MSISRIDQLAIVLVAMPLSASAHHSIAAFYDYDSPTEIEGTVTSVDWVNPHIRFTVSTATPNGDSEEWAMESGSMNMLARQGIERGTIEVGDVVTVAGYPSRHGLNEMIAGYVTAPGGEAVVLWSGLFGGLATSAPPRRTQLRSSGDAARAVATASGIYRVWTVGEPYSRDTTDEGGQMEVPYRPEALAARSAYDPLTDDTALLCIQQGMPGIMDNPFPMEIVDRGDSIEIRLEEWDVVRIVHVNRDHVDGTQPATAHGYSTGQWEDGDLVVSTSDIDWPFFDDIGTPLGDDIHIVERFSLSDDETRLDYEITVDDPATFAAPFTLDGYWVWAPGEEIKPYNCNLRRDRR
ncbi:MAG TPA: DUF6152 family protein [Gammaproteobacteria bacterium]